MKSPPAISAPVPIAPVSAAAPALALSVSIPDVSSALLKPGPPVLIALPVPAATRLLHAATIWPCSAPALRVPPHLCMYMLPDQPLTLQTARPEI